MLRPTLAAVRFSRRSSLLLAAAAVTALACSSDSTPPSSSAPRETAQAMVGPAGGTVVTPSGSAGVQVPSGTFSQSVLVTVTQLTAPQTPGAGPLSTNLKQYPPYYEFTTSPANAQLGDSVRVGVCQVTDPSSPLYAPEADHGRLRLAHTVGATVEILAPVNVSDFLRCTGVTASAQPSPSSGLKGAFASIVARAGNMLSPSPAYAAHGGLGGKVKSFSPFGAVVDACSVPAPMTLGTTVNGTLEASDCAAFAGVLADFYGFTLTAQATLRLTGTATGFQEGAIALFSANDIRVFERDLPTTNYAIIPAGNYILGLAGTSASRGSYAIESQIVSNPDGCTSAAAPIAVFLFADIIVAGAFTINDCTGSGSPPPLVDHYEANMLAGQGYQIAAIGNGMRLEVCRPDGLGGCALLQGQSNPTGSVTFTFRPTTSETYVVNLLSLPVGRLGGYTLRLTKVP